MIRTITSEFLLVFTFLLFLSPAVLHPNDNESEAPLEREIIRLEMLIESESDPLEKHQAMVELARLLELAGRIDSAQKLYIDASFLLPKEKDFSSLLSSALLLYEMGEYRDAEAQARAVIATSNSPELSARASDILIRSLAAQERMMEVREAVLKTLEKAPDNVDPSFLLFVELWGRTEGEEDLTELARSILRERFPGSPEAAVMNRTATLLPSPMLLLSTSLPPVSGLSVIESTVGPEETAAFVFSDSVAIQTGSFTMKGNAVKMVTDLEKAGFSARISEYQGMEHLYFRVVLDPVPRDSVQSVLVELKQNGYEGFPLYE